jgi:polar amino acid transport system permease protein
MNKRDAQLCIPHFYQNKDIVMAGSSDIIGEVIIASRSRATNGGFVYNFPWWLLALFFMGVFAVVLIFTSAEYNQIFRYLIPGIGMTLFVSITSYITALCIGLMIALIRSNPPQPGVGFAGKIIGFIRLVAFQIATLYVSVLRGLPILVVLLSVAFVLIPAFSNLIKNTLNPSFRFDGSSPASAIIALALTYSAFLSETLRAGIQSIEKGQTEAARSLGMNYLQTMRYVILPQAVRRVLPPLGNDFISMIKDSSLVTVLGISDITQNAKLYSSSSFRFAQTYFIAAMIYLTMTVLGSLLLRWLERRFSYGR